MANGEAAVRAGDEAIARFFAAHKAKRRDLASVEMMAALESFFSIEDRAQQREALRPLVTLLERGGLEDLKLVVLVRLVAIEQALGNGSSLGGALIEIGNVYTNLENYAEARRYTERALADAIERRAFADAASASTNIASLHARENDFAAALPPLRRSMELIAKDEPGANDHTHFVTRMMLIQVLDQLGSDTDEAITAARPIFGRLAEFLPQVRGPLVEILDRIAGRYREAHGDVDHAAWKAAILPELWGSR